MHPLLRLSEACSLALHTAATLAQPAEAPRTTHELAKRLGASEHHLAKVLQRLGKAGLVQARRGPGGGFELARPAGNIRLIDLYEAIDGAVPATACLLGKPACGRQHCILGGLTESVHQQFVHYFNHTTLADLAEPAGRADPAAAPDGD